MSFYARGAGLILTEYFHIYSKTPNGADKRDKSLIPNIAI